jgi:hypothetical protein
MPAILIVAAFCFSCPSMGFSRDSHEEGLFELRIRDVAQEFLTKYNITKNIEWHAHWFALTPHMENLVPGCKEALQVEWEREGSQTDDKNVRVHCPKTVNGGEWTITVPVATGNNIIETSRSDDKRHGLYEVREEARRMIYKYNKKHHTHWVALGADLRIMLPRCATPLRSRERKWSGKDYWTGRDYDFVKVVCTKVKPGTFGNKKRWTVQVYIACDLPPGKRNAQCRLY